MALIQNAATDKTGFLEFQVSSPSRQSADADFEKVMQTTKDAPAESKASSKNIQTQTKAETKVETKSTMKEKLAALNSKTQEKLVSAEAEVEPEKILEAVGALIADIKEILMEAFQVSGDELADVMSEMEITDIDLMNPEVINQLAIELTGADAMELLFQPEFTDTLKNINQEISALKQEVFASFDLTEKEVEQVLKELPAEQLPTDKEDRAVKVQTDKTQNQQLQNVQTQEAEVQTAAPKKEKMTDSGTGEKFSDQAEHQITHQQAAGNPVLTSVEQAVEAVLPEVDAENVVRQLVERIEVTVTEDVSSFEMQLNPEHLGKINLQVVAKDGMVTAQIATENAAVKEVLESQIVILKESLNNQGIEVEAVEVTIASHEFERNLDEHQEKEQTGEENQKKRFRFDVMEASEEELTPEDVIMRDMMLANGNQINYMA